MGLGYQTILKNDTFKYYNQKYETFSGIRRGPRVREGSVFYQTPSKGYHSLVPGLISIFLETEWVPLRISVGIFYIIYQLLT